MPQIVPSIVTAVAAYFVFSALGLIGTLTAVVIAHVVVALPFVVVLIRSRLETLDPDLTLASASLGAGPVKTFLLIVAPQILVSIAAAALLAFHVSFRRGRPRPVPHGRTDENASGETVGFDPL